MLEALTSKATAWERERGTEFLYDGVSYFQVKLWFGEVFYVSFVISLSYPHLFVICIGQTSFNAQSVQHLKAGERARTAETESMDLSPISYVWIRVFHTHNI